MRIRKSVFFDIAGLWIAIIEGEPLSSDPCNHVAFKIADAHYDEFSARISSLGLRFGKDRPRGAGEGRSIYFYDYDNHLFELHGGTLEERLQHHAR